MPFSIKRSLGRTTGGDTKYSEPEEHKCYRVDKAEAITDKYGKQYTSGTQLYVPPDVAIALDTLVVLPDDAKPREIHDLRGYFDGNTGTKSITTIYL